MRDHDINGLTGLVEFEYVICSYMVNGFDVAVGVRKALMMGAVVVSYVVDSREATNTEATEIED